MYPYYWSLYWRFHLFWGTIHRHLDCLVFVSVSGCELFVIESIKGCVPGLDYYVDTSTQFKTLAMVCRKIEVQRTNGPNVHSVVLPCIFYSTKDIVHNPNSIPLDFSMPQLIAPNDVEYF